jgi:molybdopterin synthase sulfur carrier subunit
VRLKLRYFASVKEQLGRDFEELEVPESIASVAGVRAHLRSRGGVWAEVFAESRRVTAAVNQDMVKPTAAVRAGDEVAFFPPVTGG